MALKCLFYVQSHEISKQMVPLKLLANRVVLEMIIVMFFSLYIIHLMH